MNIPDSMPAEEIKYATLDDEHLGILLKYVLHGWLLTKGELQKELQPYCPFTDKIASIDGITVNVVQ